MGAKVHYNSDVDKLDRQWQGKNLMLTLQFVGPKQIHAIKQTVNHKYNCRTFVL